MAYLVLRCTSSKVTIVNSLLIGISARSDSGAVFQSELIAATIDFERCLSIGIPATIDFECCLFMYWSKVR